MKQSAAIRRASKQAQLRMQALDGELSALLLRQYEDAAAQVRAAIAQRLGPDDAVAREQLQGLLRQIEDIVGRLGEARDAALADGIQRAAGLGVEPLTMQGLAGAQAVLDSAAAMRVSEAAVRFVTTFQAADGLVLSDRLWRLTQGASEVLSRAISTAVVQGWSAARAVADLAYSGQPVSPDLAARIVAGKGDALTRVADLLTTGDGAELWKADRVMRTEINRAHGEAYMNGATAAHDVVGFRFLLSPMHPRPDICDLLASQNLHGLGPGVYPDRESCPWPAHPNTLSFVVAVFRDELTDADRAGKETELQALQRLAPDVREGVLGKTKADYFDQGLLRRGAIRSPLRAVRARLQRQGSA